MDIQQAQEEKRLLERLIKKAMDDFSVKTGLAVDSIQVSSALVYGSEVFDFDAVRSGPLKPLRPQHFNHGIHLEVRL
jgi:hypothetical protein